jgi:hypothetical protein
VFFNRRVICLEDGEPLLSFGCGRVCTAVPPSLKLGERLGNLRPDGVHEHVGDD